MPKNLEEKLMKNWRGVYFHKPFREKATFNCLDKENEALGKKSRYKTHGMATE